MIAINHLLPKSGFFSLHFRHRTNLYPISQRLEVIADYRSYLRFPDGGNSLWPTRSGWFPKSRNTKFGTKNLRHRSIVWCEKYFEIMNRVWRIEKHKDRTAVRNSALVWCVLKLTAVASSFVTKYVWPYAYFLVRSDFFHWFTAITNGWLIDWVRLNVPPNTLQVISGTDFYGSNDPTNSVKALKEHIKVNQIEQNTKIHLN